MAVGVLTAAHNGGYIRCIRLQLADGLLCLRLRDDSHGGVGHKNEKNDCRIHKGSHPMLPIQDSEQKGDDGGGNEDLHKKIIELLQDELPKWSPCTSHNNGVQ